MRPRALATAFPATLWALALTALSLAPSPSAAAAEGGAVLRPCRLKGVEHDAQCGTLLRPLDPSQPQGRQIELHFAVLPALARNRLPDPVFFFAGGPGQSAMGLGGTVTRLLARVSNRRDVVLVDQRGTGRSAPLICDEPAPTTALAEVANPDRAVARLLACRAKLQTLPHGDLRHYTTWVAMQDADAVRQALGARQVNLVGGSYGTRAVLEYMRQFPQAVRRAVIDGVAPPDMSLPAAMAADNQAALDAVFDACAAEPACAARYPALRDDWRALLASLPREASVAHPVTGASERLTLTRDSVLGLVRSPLYAPLLASALPLAVSEAARGRFEPLFGLSTALGGGRPLRMAEGMHFSVVCAEDLPRLTAAPAPVAPVAPDFADATARLYQRVCEGWPQGAVPAAFYALPPAPAATWVLSGGADPVTPPRHGQRVATALGAKTRHLVVPQAGHGVLGIGCLRDALYRFIDAPSDDEALQVDTTCATAIPRPPAFIPVGAASPGAARQP